MVRKIAINYLIGAVVLFVFQFVYHQFSHGVISAILQYAWVVPIISFLLYWALTTLSHSKNGMTWLHSGTVIIVNGMVLQGILEIAGSDSPYILWYFIAGILCVFMAVVTLFLTRHQVGSHERRNV